MTLSQKNIDYIIQSVISTDELIGKNSKDIFPVIFEYAPDESFIEGDVVLTSELFDELVKIGKSFDSEYDPIMDVGDENFAMVYLASQRIEIGIPGDKEPYTDNPNADCIGDFEIDIRTGKVDFDVRCDT